MHRVLLSARQPAQAEPAPEDVAFHPARVGQALRDLRRTAAPGVKLPARVFACGFSLNKRRILRRFAGDSIVHCVRHARRIPPGSTLLLWGSTAAPPGLTADVALIRVERSEEHTSELQSQSNLVCRLLLEKKKNNHSIIELSDAKSTWTHA